MVKLTYGGYGMKVVFNSIKLLLVFSAMLLCQQGGLTKTESKITNNNLNKTLDLNAMAIKIEELRVTDLYTPIDTYMGRLTGYAADCPLCGGTLGCTGQNVLRDRITTFQDKDYGIVRIVASSRSLPCGSIIQFNLASVSNQKITAIVLDRGVVGTAIDLLMESEDEARVKVGSRQISYDILRFGYKR